MKIAYWTTTDTNNCTVYVARWQTQTFPTGFNAWIITHFRLKVKRVGACAEPFIYSIKNVAADHKPTGDDLCSWSVAPSRWSTTDTWRTFTFPSTINLSANTEYAIVMKSPGNAFPNCPNMRYDAVAPTYYPTGYDFESNDSGVTWTPTMNSFVFEVYGLKIEPREFNDLMNTFKRSFRGSSSFEVTRSALALGDRDTMTGWYAKSYTDSTINMILIQKEAQNMALRLGYYVSLDALGLTVDAIDVYDLITDKFDRTWEVKTVKPIPVGDAIKYFVCDLKELPLYA